MGHTNPQNRFIDHWLEHGCRVDSGEALETRAASSLHLLQVLEREVVDGRTPDLKSGALHAAQGFDQLVAAIRELVKTVRTFGTLLLPGSVLSNLELTQAQASSQKDRALKALEQEQGRVRAACLSGNEVHSCVGRRDTVRRELRGECIAGIERICVELGVVDAWPHNTTPEEIMMATVQEFIVSINEGLGAAFGQDESVFLQSAHAAEFLASADPWDDWRLSEVLDAYSRWVDSCDRRELARATDEAVKRGNAVGLASFLGAGDACIGTHDGRTALSELGTALDKEQEWQNRDHLESLPRAELQGCALSLLRALQQREITLQSTVRIRAELSHQRDLQEALLDESSAVQTTLREELQKLGGVTDDLDYAEKKMESARRRLASITELAEKACGSQQQSGDMLQGALTAVTEEVRASKQQFKEARAALKETLKAVIEHEQEFPEVMVNVKVLHAGALLVGVGGWGLARGLVEMLDPPMSLETFDELHVLSQPPRSRHVVHKVQDGTGWFTIKVLPLSAGK